ncbi:MAG TPA: hypothetical protein VLS27_08415 [Gammaproteobacteria bacterium]|nr:hypothetical protein [Gammaproteobacteria bacterium]
MKPNPFCLALALAAGLSLSACSSEDNEVQEHVWKDQVEAIDKAREVENVIMDAATAQKKASEDASY